MREEERRKKEKEERENKVRASINRIKTPTVKDHYGYDKTIDEKIKKYEL